MRFPALLLALMLPTFAPASETPTVVQSVVDGHILPRINAFAAETETLRQSALTDCTAESVMLKSAYNDAFDTWVSISHLRFGPTEVDNRAFALAFWPDTRGKTPKVLAQMIATADPAATSAQAYQDVSIAARGFYALEFLLYDDTLSTAGEAAYHCTLVQTVTADIANIAGEIRDDWANGYTTQILNPAENGPYQISAESTQEVFKALVTGLQFTSDTRMGRPLGSFEKARPKRAEAWRSGRSLHNVVISLSTLRELTALLAVDDPRLATQLDQAFAYALSVAGDLNDPIFTSVATTQGRFEVDILRQAIDAIREMVVLELGPALGVGEGFNALDGD